MTIEEVLREMREYGADGGSGYNPDIVYVWADAIEAAMREKDADIKRLQAKLSECDGKLGKRPCQTGRCMEYLELQSALRRCLELMHNGGTWDIGEQHRMATLAGKEPRD